MTLLACSSLMVACEQSHRVAHFLQIVDFQLVTTSIEGNCSRILLNLLCHFVDANLVWLFRSACATSQASFSQWKWTNTPCALLPALLVVWS